MAVIEGTRISGARARPWEVAAAPTNGAAGTLAGAAMPGDLLLRTDAGNIAIYQNTNTQASPTWTQLSAAANTLDAAYDQGGAGAGRTITADTGAVAITVPVAANNAALALTQNDTTNNPAALTIANAGTGNDITGAGSSWTVAKGGQGTFTNLVLANGTVPAGTSAYVARDNAGDLTLNALTTKSVNLAVAGTDVVTVAGAAVTVAQALTVSAGGLTVSTGGAAITGNSTVTGDLNVTGSLTFGGNWTVAATLTVDELILDTDGAAPAGTNCYAVRDNAGDFTVNAVTAKQFIVAINGSDEYTFSGTVLDLLDNALDNVGYLILNAATAPAGTEVYAVNDNTGDLTLNALTGKTINLAIAGTDEYVFSATALALATNNLTLSTGSITFSGAGAVDLGATGYLIAGTAANATGKIRLANNTWVSAENAAASGNINLISANTSDLVAFGANLAAATMGGTLTLGTQQLSLSTGNITFSGAGYIAMGVNPAASGYVRLLNAGVIAWRNAANGADISAIQVNTADDVQLGADLQMAASTVYGDTASGGNLTLASTTNATKGAVVVPNAELGLKVGGTAARATTPGTNAIHLFNGTAPAGTLTNGGSLYSEGGELKVLDALGNSTTISPHTPDGDYVIHSYSALKDETVTIHVEKLLKALAATPALQRFVHVAPGHVKAPALPV